MYGLFRFARNNSPEAAFPRRMTCCVPRPWSCVRRAFAATLGEIGHRLLPFSEIQNDATLS